MGIQKAEHLLVFLSYHHMGAFYLQLFFFEKLQKNRTTDDYYNYRLIQQNMLKKLRTSFSIDHKSKFKTRI